MKILGISSNYHDASAALVVDGKVKASAAEERFTLQKHDPCFPSFSIDYCLEEAGITAADLDLVVYHEDPHSKFTRSLSSAFTNFPFSVSTFIKAAREMITSGFWVKNEISKYLDIDPDKIITIPHHMSHAAHAFLTSPFKEAAIMTVDAVGEWSATCFFKATKKGNSFDIEPVEIFPFPHSLGLVYSAFTGFLGFKVNDGECSTMALASFGKPTYAEQIEEIILMKEDGSYEIDLSFFDFSSDSKLPLTEKFVSIFGQPRSYKNTLPFSSFPGDTAEVSSDDQRYADIASSLQFVLEKAVLGLAQRLRLKVQSENLCYAGGVALNCVANSRLIESGLFKNVYIPPDPGDGGGAMGAALFASLKYDKAAPAPVSPYLGKEYDVKEFASMLEHLDPKEWFRFSKIKLAPLKKENIKFRILPSEEILMDYICKAIHDKKIVGWFQGRFENGPRALGNRSILCRPDSIEVARRLSTTVKLRASFRPYACSMTKEEADNILQRDVGGQLEKWMQCSFKVKESAYQDIKAACHVDMTTRAQVCEETDNPKYWKLLNHYKKYSGRAALLNTSFNESGFPIVAGPLDALVNFARTDLDILVIDNFIVEKIR